MTDQLVTAAWLSDKLGHEHGLQSELAAALGVDRSIVNKMKSGIRGIRQDEALRIREFFEARQAAAKTPAQGYDLQAAAERLHEARVQACLTPLQASQATGIDYPIIASHEKARRPFMADHAVRYAKAYGTSLDWLYTGIAAPHAPPPTQNGLPPHAHSAIRAIARAFDPDTHIVAASGKDIDLLEEAAETFKRVHGPDRPDDAQRLSDFLEAVRAVREADSQ